MKTGRLYIIPACSVLSSLLLRLDTPNKKQLHLLPLRPEMLSKHALGQLLFHEFSRGYDCRVMKSYMCPSMHILVNYSCIGGNLSELSYVLVIFIEI